MSRMKKPLRTSVPSRRPKLPHVSEEMKAWSAALSSETAEWPRLTSRPMFGLMALYRGERIFAVLPRSRAMGTPNSVAFKLDDAQPRLLTRLRKDARIRTTMIRAKRWFVFELSSDRDLKDALDWLERAYEAAG